MNQDIIRALSFSVPTALFFVCLFPYRAQALRAIGLKSPRKREATILGFVMILSAILALKLWPVCMWQRNGGVWGDLLLLINRPSWDTMLNLIPLGSIPFYQGCIDYGTGHLATIIWNRVGNILVFIPLGFFPALLFRKANWKNTALAGLGLSLFTEVGQYFLMRYASIDDVLLNTLGTVLGYVFYLALQKICPKFTSSFKCTVSHTAKYL